MDQFASDIRVGNVLKTDSKLFKVIGTEVRGSGKSGKTVHLRLKNLEDGNFQEKSLRAEDKAQLAVVEHQKMQYLYRDGDLFNFMNMTSYEQFGIPAKAIGKQEIFLKENLEISVLFAENRPVSLEFPKQVELRVTSCPPPSGSGANSNFKEIGLENGLTILGPQFIKEGDSVRVNTDDLSYAERVTVKSMKENT